MTGRVHECGCIALPETLQAQTGLYPGATYSIEVMPEGAGVILLTMEPKQPSEPNRGDHCG